MNAHRTPLGMRRGLMFLGVIACGLAIASVYLWRELEHERTHNAELRARLESKAPVAALLSTGSPTPPAAAVTPSKPAPAPAPASVAPATPTPVAAKAVSPEEDWNARQRRLLRDPRYREVQLEQGRLMFAQRRENLVRLLGLTPEQADAVIDLQLERQLQLEERSVNPPTGELTPQQEQLFQAQGKEHETKLRELLGDTRYAQLDHYMESRQSRMQVDRFRTQLSSSDTLRDDQVEPLIEALHVERTRMWEELKQYRYETPFGDGQSNDSPQLQNERQLALMKEMHADMHASAATILSSSQLKQLDAELNRELKRYEAQMRMSQIQSKLESAGGAAPQSN